MTTTANEARERAFSSDTLACVDANAKSTALTIVRGVLSLVPLANPNTLKAWRANGLMADARFTFAPVKELGTPGWLEIHEGLGLGATPGGLAFEWYAALKGSLRKWAYWAGAKGVGKTYLASVLAQHWTIETGRPALLIQWADFLNKIQSTFSYSSERDRPDHLRGISLQRAIAAPFLVVDDVAVGHSVVTKWALEKLWTLCDQRIGRPTIFTSNLTLSRWERSLAALAAETPSLKDVTEKIADRFGTGDGGNVGSVIGFVSKVGSMRRRDAHG